MSLNCVSFTRQFLTEIVDEFQEEIGRKPSVNELLEILSWGLKSFSNSEIEDFYSPNFVCLEPKFQVSGKTKLSRKGNVESLEDDNLDLGVGDLNDNVFVLASDFMSDLASAIKSDLGKTPTLDEFSNILLAGLMESDENLLLDVNFKKKISEIKFKFNKGKKISVQPGDIVAIPAKNGNFFLACIVAKNSFGTAYGFFQGTFTLRPNPLGEHPNICKYPIYSGDDFIASGRWKIIGRDESILSSFPDEPEIYHANQIIDIGIHIGKYGSGETASGVMRDLTKEEAEEIGLLSNDYQQVYLEEELERFLNSKI